MSQDLVQRFLFEEAPIRGEWVGINDAWQEILLRHSYPPELRRILGEWLAAAVLMRAMIKFDGNVLLQLQGHGPLRLMVVECADGMRVRATARWEGDLTGMDFKTMAGDGTCVITLDGGDGKPGYQGIVPLEGDSVAQVLEAYMRRSEQLETRFLLAADDQHVHGLLLQKLPEGHGDADIWTRIRLLLDTVGAAELLQTDAPTLLYRLFHQDTVQLLLQQEVHFGCTCSREKVAAMLKMLGEAEVVGILHELGRVGSVCEFCNSEYVFDAVDIGALFLDHPPAAPGIH